MLSGSGWTSWLDVKVQARTAVEVEVKAEGWSWSWSWNGSWSGSWELAGAPKMAAGASPPTDLDKSPLDPPKSAFWIQMPLLGPNGTFALGIFPLLGPCFKNGKLCLRSRRPAIQFPLFTWSLLSKMQFEGTLGPHSTWRTPHFHRFPSY